MSTRVLNVWTTKVVGEIGNCSGGRYSPRTLEQIVSGINRHNGNVNGVDGENTSASGDGVRVRTTTERVRNSCSAIKKQMFT